MRRILFAIALLLSGCFSLAGVDWHDELVRTHWSACNTNEKCKTNIQQFSSRISQFKMPGQGYTTCNRKLVTITRLNEEGIRLMEKEGCNACHQVGGTLPSILSVIRFTGNSDTIIPKTGERNEEIITTSELVRSIELHASQPLH